ncbi:hypothetical protein [Nitrosomonas ureae]|uniref:Uncharacterized protein n=1 Tax=Nitrosomonas ureae TaxID=44577 RepID=A0A1H2GDL7_9PROT|nr:hypothetical protein [Nitrosomonas ureae]SDU17478.1 hypothetical protein SAMN05216406_13037 [Nitrosomonas ureae]
MEEQIKKTSEDKVPAVVEQFILDGYTTIMLKKVDDKWIITASN